MENDEKQELTGNQIEVSKRKKIRMKTKDKKRNKTGILIQ